MKRRAAVALVTGLVLAGCESPTPQPLGLEAPERGPEFLLSAHFTFFVAPSGSGGGSCENPDFNTIQAAINATEPGDVVVVCSGEYVEHLFTANRPGITITSTNVHDPEAAGAIIRGFIHVNAANVTVTGLVVTRREVVESPTVNQNGFFIGPNGSGSSIVRNHIVDNRNIGIGSAPESSNVTIQRNEIIGNGAWGIGLQGTGYVLHNNVISNNTSIGIIVNGNNNDFQNNTITDNGGRGIDLRGDNNHVHRNTLCGNDTHDIRAGTGPFSASNNVIRRNVYGVASINLAAGNQFPTTGPNRNIQDCP